MFRLCAGLLIVTSLDSGCGWGDPTSDNEPIHAKAEGGASRFVTDVEAAEETDNKSKHKSEPQTASDSTLSTLEALSQSVDAHFKSLAEHVVRDSAPQHWLTANRFPVAEQFTCEGLRPTDTTIALDDGSFQVARHTGDTPLTRRTPPHAGWEGFRRVVFDWLKPFARAKHRRCKFKIFGIQQNDGKLTAQLHSHISGQLKDARLEENAVWETRWIIRQKQALQLIALKVHRLERAQLDPRTGPVFRDRTVERMGHLDAYQTQLRFGLNYWLDRFELGLGILPTGYQGMAVGDVNGDGRDDLFVPQSGGILTGLPNRLFLQAPDGTLRDVSEAMGVDWFAETHGALFLDLDNDGDQDLVIATVGGLAFLENEAGNYFQPRATKLMPEAPPISLAAADYDNDQDLDIYACCYAYRSSSDIIGRPLPYHDANNGGRNALFRNDGHWKFRNATVGTGLNQNNQRFSFAAAWEDFDQDGDQDLYVSNDYGRNNLYRNDDGQFVDVAATFGVEDVSAGMSACWGDYNRDGWMDIYVGNMWSSAGNRIAYQRQFQSSAPTEVRATFQRHARGNSLFRNPGMFPSNQPFTDVSLEANVAMGRWAWTSRFADINNDGWQDLVVANGFITQENHQDL